MVQNLWTLELDDIATSNTWVWDNRHEQTMYNLWNVTATIYLDNGQNGPITILRGLDGVTNDTQ